MLLFLDHEPIEREAAAENGYGIIVRVTEHGGSDGTVTVSVPDWAKGIWRTDLPEKRAEPLPCGKRLALPLRAFEIATLRCLT